jgi:V/A-type H+-transporting ATPase subunit I
VFYPRAMTEIEMIVPAKDLLPVTNALATQRVFHEVDSSYVNVQTDSGPADSWHERAVTYAALERRLLAIMQTLDVAEGPPPASRALMIEIDVVDPLVEQIELETRKTSEQLADAQKRLDQLESYIHQLEPVAGIDLDVSVLRHSRYIFSMLGIIPVANLERLETSLARIPFVLLTLRRDNRRAIVWLAGTQHNADILSRAARSAYLNPLTLPDTYQGTPSEIIDAVQIGIKRAQQHVAEQKTTMLAVRETHQQQLQTLLWRVRASRLLADAMARFGRLRYTYLIVGWVPSSELAGLSQRLRQASEGMILQSNPFRRSGGTQDVPVALNNPGILHAFQQLVTTYARPLYSEVDPTLLIAVTFPLLFGAMFGDVGHGLILALLGGLVASRKIHALQGMASLGTIVAICGLAATVFGFLYGSVFGLENVFPVLWIRPMDHITQILIITIAAGIALLCLGFLLSILNAWRARDWGRFFFDRNGIAGFVLYASLVGLAVVVFLGNLPIPPLAFAAPVALAGLAVMFSEVLKHLVEGRRPLIDENLGTYAIQAVFELFETLVSFLSNSLSYVRVGAFAVAHGGLAAVVFVLADLAGSTHGVGYWVVILLGNLFIVGFEGLIVGIQTMRLEYYEFFGKFFTGGGLRYDPLTLLPAAEE